MKDYVKQWAHELDFLESIIQKSNLVKTIKWGAPVYTLNGKNVVGFYGFKDYFALWFYNGVFLVDKHKVLVAANEEKTHALRQWRFKNMDEINEILILEYIYEAIQNEIDGKVWKPQKSSVLEIPELLKNEFDLDINLHLAFKKLTPYKQKDYVEYIHTAKRDETKIARIQKIIPMIRDGIGLNDKYKKC